MYDVYGGVTESGAEMRRLLERVREDAERTGWHWRYLETGMIAHALAAGAHGGLNRVAACGMFPRGYWSEWLGGGSQREYERAATMPKCRRCMRRAVEQA
ncbi:MAG TPA: hypothetical protein VE326_11325 [Candidatus Binatia bacterium]|nr:hypothetical protein [Candidatus Binatia bacterium]